VTHPAKVSSLVVLLALPVAAMPPREASAKAKAKAKQQVQAALLAPVTAAVRRPAKSELRPGANLARCDLSGMDLRGVDLRGANLDDSDLVGTNFGEADLSRATLRRARMAGASLAGARLFQTDFSSAAGLNLSGAALHPFFHTDPDEAGSDTTKVFLLDPELGCPTRMEIGSTGALFLQETGTHRNGVLSPFGTVFNFWEAKGQETNLRAMGRDGLNHLWAIRDDRVAVFPDSVQFVEPGEEYRNLQGLRGVTATAAGQGKALYASVTDKGETLLLVLEPQKASLKLRVTTIPLKNLAFQSMAAVPGQASRYLLGVHPSRDEVTLVNLMKQRVEGLALALGSRPTRLVAGADGKVWFLAPGANTVGFVEMQGGEPRVTQEFVLPSEGKRDLRLRGLACAPDGGVWVTLQSPPALGRIGPDFVMKRWALLGGVVPSEIVCGKDGQVFFTVVGRPMLGSFRPAGALAPPEDASSSWTIPPPSSPTSSIPRLSGRARRERALARELPSVEEVDGPAEPLATPLHEEKKVAIPPPESKGEVPPPVPKPKPEAAEPVGSPWDVLAAMDIHLSEDRIDHILKRHSHGLAGGWGQFHLEASTREGLVALLAKGLEKAGEAGRVLKRYDPSGILHTPCWLGVPVGRYQSYGVWKETDCIDVVTLRVRLEDGTTTQVLLSAYPVNPRKY
jgi:hypothetical protein